ncbi:MAG: GGDEF domain-containing protein [Motiliproteus sp.]
MTKSSSSHRKSLSKIWRQLILQLALIVLAFILASWILINFIEKTYEESLLQSRNMMVGEIINNIIIDALIIEDIIFLTNALSNVSESIPEIVYIEIQNENGDLLSKSGALSANTDIDLSISSITQSVLVENELFGKIIFQRDTRQDSMAINQTINKIHWSYVFVICCFLLFTLTIIYRRTKPLFLRVIHQSLHDPLTGIPNRRMYDEIVKSQLGRAKRDHSNVGVILLDIDFFKAYNDHYGHEQGDQCLKQVASVLKHIAGRASDVVARSGGEEFSIFISDDGCDIHALSDKCCRYVESLAIPHAYSNCSDVITISAGFFSGMVQANQGIKELSLMADKALYTAKSNGRNCVHAFQAPSSHC